MWLPEPPAEPPQSPSEEPPPLSESPPQSPSEDPPLLSVEPLLSGVLEPLSVEPLSVVPLSVVPPFPPLSVVVPVFPFEVPVLPEEVPPLEPAASWAARSAAARCSAMVSCWAWAISAVTSELRLAV